MNSANVSPNTPILLWTVEFGSKNQILRLLEEEKADLNGTNENGDTVLHLIFRNENLVERDVVSLLKIFLDRGLLDPNAENKRGERILHVAVANRMKSVVEVLIIYGADVDMDDREGNSIAHLFMEDERKKFLGLLKLNERRSSKVEEMASESASFVELLIEKGVDFDRVNKQKKGTLHLSIEYNLQHISFVLLKHIRNVNRHDNSLLHLFLKKLNDEYFKALDCYSSYTSRYATGIVKLLLETGASAVVPDIFGVAPLRVAIEKQETSIVETMIDHHLKSCDNNAATIFFSELLKSCAWWGESRTGYFLRILGELMAKGADVNAKDKNGMTPMYHAFHCKNRQAVDFLADCGADFAVSSEDGENLFHALARKGPRFKSDGRTAEALFELLVNKKCCDLNAKNRDDETPLHVAVKSGNLAIVRKLMEQGVEINCKNKYKETPVHLAVQHHQTVELVELLLKSGADVNSKDHRGRRPLLLAVDSALDPNPWVSILLQWGAYVNIRNQNLSAFCTAIKVGCSSNAKEMLAYGLDINDQSIVSFLRKLGPRERSMKAVFVSDHWMKLMTAGLPYSQEYHTFEENTFHHVFHEFYARLNLQVVHDACLKEVDTLKATFIDGHTSVYSFLRMDFGSRLIHTENENFKKLIDCQNLKQHFPMYKDVILASYRETILWNSLLEPAKRALFQLTNIQLSRECCALIFTHLENQDLVNIIECDEEV